MDLSFALRFFSIMLLIIGIALALVIMRRDPIPVESIVHIPALANPRGPGLLTQIGIVNLLMLFVLLPLGCYLLLIA